MHAWDMDDRSVETSFCSLFMFSFPYVITLIPYVITLIPYVITLIPLRNNVDTAGCRHDADGTACQEKDQSRPQDV